MQKSHFSPFHQEIQGLLQNKVHSLDVSMKHYQNIPWASLNPINGWFCTATITTHVTVLNKQCATMSYFLWLQITRGGRTSPCDYVMILRKVEKYFTSVHGFYTKYRWRAHLGIGTYFDSTLVALYNGVNPMRKDSSVTVKQGLW